MKKFRKILLCLCLSFTIFALASCGQAGLDTMPDLEDKVTGNGGLAVQKGEYVYFVDSYVNASSLSQNDNKQGEVKTAALYRTKLENGKLDVDNKGNLDSYELVVSKVVGTENTALFIFDDYIYYSTPNMQKDREGDLRTDLLQFCRAKLDGTNIEVLYTSDQYTDGATYAFYKIGSSVYLVVFDGKNIKQVEITSYAKNAITLASNVSKVILPTIPDYEYTNNNQVAGTQGYVYYTRDLTEEDFYNPSNKGNALGRVSITNADNKQERKDGQTTYELKSVQSNYLYVYKSVNGNKCMYAISDFASFNNVGGDVQITATSDYTKEFVMPNIDGNNLGVIVNYGGKTVWVKDGMNVANNTTLINDGEREIIYANADYAYYLDGTSIYRIILEETDLEKNVELVVSDENIDTKYLDFADDDFVYYFSTYTGDNGSSQEYLNRVNLSEKILPEDPTSEETDLGYKVELMGVLKAKHINHEI